MEHPGQPQFLAVGDAVQLAPRDPDPDAEYSWTISDAPLDSDVTLGDDSVEHFVPDAPGRYVATLTTPEDTFDQTIRVFPSGYQPTGEGTGATGVSGYSGYSGYSGKSGSSPRARARAARAFGSTARFTTTRP